MSFITAYSETQQLLAYTSLFFIVFAISMIIVRPWVGKIYDRKGASAVICPSFIFFAIGLVIVSFISNQWMLWLSAIFIGIGYGSLFPCFQTVAIQSSAPVLNSVSATRHSKNTEKTGISNRSILIMSAVRNTPASQ